MKGRLTAIVLCGLVLLSGSTSLAGLRRSLSVTTKAVFGGHSLVRGTVFLHCEGTQESEGDGRGEENRCLHPSCSEGLYFSPVSVDP
jgi:hypothetical protein